MRRFYFHTRANDVVVVDHQGLQLHSEQAACEHAIEGTPLLLKQSREQNHNTHVSTQICDESEHTIAVIRGTVVLEMR